MSLSSNSSLRPGYTWIELLVVIAVISILIALVAPAVLKMRENAAQTQCRNNLKQIALAARGFETQHGDLAPGYVGPKNNKTTDTAVAYGDAENNQWVGHLPLLLPFLDQVALFQKIQINPNPTAQGLPWWEPKPTAADPLPPNYQVAVQRLAVFLCPSNSNQAIPFQAGGNRGTVVGIHVYNTGPFFKIQPWVENYDDGSGNPYEWRLAPTNYVGVCGAGKGSSPWWTQWEGAYTNRSRIRLADIKDGASQTLLYGEASGRADVDRATGDLVPEALNISWFGGGVLPSGVGLASGKTAFWYQFSSYHTSGVSFAFADGSVRTLSFATDPYVLLQLSGIRDGFKPPPIE